LGDEGFGAAVTLLVENTESPRRPFPSVVSAQPVTAKMPTWPVSAMLEYAWQRKAEAGGEFEEVIAMVGRMHCWTHMGRM
jgi:hypothetical protein